MRLFLVAFLVQLLPGQTSAPPSEWPRAKPADVNMDEGLLVHARDYALHGGGSGYVIRHGKLVFSWGDPKQKYDLKSSTKAIGVTALGLAIQDGKVKLTDRAQIYEPGLGVPPGSNRATGWLKEITLFHLATQTAGFDKPGGYQPLLFRPGTKWSYSDGGPNWLAECLTLVYQRDLEELMFERVFGPLGITPADLHWRKNAYRPAEINGIPRREFGSGIHANVDAMARIGYLYLNHGRIGQKPIIPAKFVDMVQSPIPKVESLPVLLPEKYPNASHHYGLLWWNNGDGTLAKVPRDAFWSWGLYDSLIVVVPTLDLVVARAGRSFPGAERSSGYDRLRPFLEPIAESALPSSSSKPPYPQSPVIEGVSWAPTSTIIRKALGSDNWPATWADDDNLYTAYGDGWGFQPKVPRKLGLGFAKVAGAPPDFSGTNIRSETGENTGQGKEGRKASGMLMVDGVLYMWARNAGNSQLAWSTDHAKTWAWSQWKFSTSFGHPTFLNFGKNYAGARDKYVYIYSPDADSAYVPSSRMVMARVPKDRIREKSAYEFFRRLDSNGKPLWTKDVRQRGAVFINAPERCYRTQVSYNAGLKRYFMNQILPGDMNTRFKGGFGIYDAAEPWGPWTTVYFTELWDVAPGENQNFPTKWMSGDGKTMYLVFSGEDMFSVRKVTLKLR
jgi:CubicO group peptidase (beta-lactamase class C family)